MTVTTVLVVVACVSRAAASKHSASHCVQTLSLPLLPNTLHSRLSRCAKAKPSSTHQSVVNSAAAATIHSGVQVLLLAADLRIGPSDLPQAKFGLNEVAIGMVLPEFGRRLAHARMPGKVRDTLRRHSHTIRYSIDSRSCAQLSIFSYDILENGLSE